MSKVIASSLQLEVPTAPEFAHVLSVEALQFVAQLEHEFGARRRELLAARSQRQLA
ncbi:MAG: Malate synthase, partial [Chloroflexota bacterium]